MTRGGRWGWALAALVAGSTLVACESIFGLDGLSHPCRGVPAGEACGPGAGGGDALCADGKRDGKETDVDCGGGACDPCAAGKGCAAGSDCTSGVCVDGHCADLSCGDQVKNGGETDVDCGGPDVECPRCASGKDCSKDGDCASLRCKSGKCTAPACNDNLKNGDETDLDCGGTICTPCQDGDTCLAGRDCESGICLGNACQVPNCFDFTKNGPETDIDCGGTGGCPGCLVNQTCGVDGDCQSNVCLANVCSGNGCGDGQKDGTESDIDCGGTCAACPPGMACNGPADCDSGVCTANVCDPPSCTDGVRNGTESDVDCGGSDPSCARCPLNLACSHGSDCATGLCLPNGGGLACQGASTISVGGAHTCGITALGGLLCWGSNSKGQLGTNSTTPSLQPVQVPGFEAGTSLVAAGLNHTCAVQSGGGSIAKGVYCWGSNTYGQLGTGNTADSLVPAALTGITTAQSIAAGGFHTCLVKSGGGVVCFGNGAYGALGNGSVANSASPVTVAGLSASQVGVGGVLFYAFSCALTTAGKIACWGSNHYGQLGNGTTTDSKVPVTLGAASVTSLAVGGLHACAEVGSAPTLKCWGYNSNGQLGDGSTADESLPHLLSSNPSVASGLSAGSGTTCAAGAGFLQCWGYNGNGQVGVGSTVDKHTPSNVFGSNYTAVARGSQSNTSCAVLNGGFVCWGANGSGEVGDGTTTQRLTPTLVTTP